MGFRMIVAALMSLVLFAAACGDDDSGIDHSLDVVSPQFDVDSGS